MENYFEEEHLPTNQPDLDYYSSKNSHDPHGTQKYFGNSRYAPALYAVSYFIVTFVGVICNKRLVDALSTTRQMKMVKNTFLRNHALANMLLILVSIFPSLFTIDFMHWTNGPNMCKAVVYIKGVSMCVSIYSLMAFSVDRYLANVHDIERLQGLSKSQAKLSLFFIWIAAIVIAFPWVSVLQLEQSDEQDERWNKTVPSAERNDEYCFQSWTEAHSNIYFITGNFVLCFVLPITVTVCIIFQTWRHLIQFNFIPGSKNLDESQHDFDKTFNEVIKMVFVMTFTFTISWLPFYFMSFGLRLEDVFTEPSKKKLLLLLPFSQWLAVVSSCVNPLIYAYFNDNVREDLRLDGHFSGNRLEIVDCERHI